MACTGTLSAGGGLVSAPCNCAVLAKGKQRWAVPRLPTTPQRQGVCWLDAPAAPRATTTAAVSAKGRLVTAAGQVMCKNLKQQTRVSLPAFHKHSHSSVAWECQPQPLRADCLAHAWRNFDCMLHSKVRASHQRDTLSNSELCDQLQHQHQSVAKHTNTRA